MFKLSDIFLILTSPGYDIILLQNWEIRMKPIQMYLHNLNINMYIYC